MERSLLTYFGACDSRFSDEQILAILLDAERGMQPLAELCAAHGVTIPMFCVWKARYRGLTADALRARRRRADWRARLLFGGVLAGIAGTLAAGAALVLFVSGAPMWTDGGVRPDRTGASQAAMEARAATEPEVMPGAAEPPLQRALEPEFPAQEPASGAPDPAPPVPELTRPEPRQPADAVVGEEAPLVRSPSAPATTSFADEGYAVQVAAAPTDAHAREIMETLKRGGHSVFVVPVTVNEVEYFRVRVGPFDTPGAAGEAAAALKRGGHPGAWVVR